MTDDDAVLAVNRAFYSAFAKADLTSMDALWAWSVPVLCIHPGWPVLEGRTAVMASWRDILSGGAPPVRVRDEKVRILGDVAIVTCEESIDRATLSTTNLFVREDGAWRLMHHQATPRAVRQPQGGTPTKKPPVLH